MNSGTLTFEDIKNAISCLSKPTESFGLFNFRSSDLFPFEIMYDACDIKTKQQIKIPSGEMCHGVLIDNNATVSAKFIELLNPTNHEYNR